MVALGRFVGSSFMAFSGVLNGVILSFDEFYKIGVEWGLNIFNSEFLLKQMRIG